MVIKSEIDNLVTKSNNLLKLTIQSVENVLIVSKLANDVKQNIVDVLSTWK